MNASPQQQQQQQQHSPELNQSRGDRDYQSAMSRARRTAQQPQPTPSQSSGVMGIDVLAVEYLAYKDRPVRGKRSIDKVLYYKEDCHDGYSDQPPRYSFTD